MFVVRSGRCDRGDSITALFRGSGGGGFPRGEAYGYSILSAGNPI